MFSVLRIISIYLEYPDSTVAEECRIDSLQALLVLLQLGEPRVRFHAKTIFEMLIRLLYETSKNIITGPNEKQRMLFDLCSECLKLGAQFAPDEFKLLCDGMEHVNVNEHFNSVIKCVFTGFSIEDTNSIQTLDNTSLLLCMQKP